MRSVSAYGPRRRVANRERNSLGVKHLSAHRRSVLQQATGTTISEFAGGRTAQCMRKDDERVRGCNPHCNVVGGRQGLPAKLGLRWITHQ